MSETEDEKKARELKERLVELRNDPRHGDLRIMVLDLFESEIIPAFKDKGRDGPGKNLWDYLFGTPQGE